MANPLNDLLNSPIPAKLWHYTSIQGFQGILMSKEMFATEVRFLNDRTEFTHAREMAKTVVEETDEFGANFFPARDYSRLAVDQAFESGPLSFEHIQVFVASFSAAEDQLSQWRGYSQGSSGVSLAFNLSALRPPMGIDILVSFAPCVYEPEDKKKLLRHALSHFVKETQEYWNSAHNAFANYVGPSPLAKDPKAVKEIVDKIVGDPKFKDDLKVAVVKTQADLLRVAALSKDESFYEEQEWRLVLPVSTKKGTLKNPPRFRAGNTTLVPYIAYPFSPDPAAVLPLRDVILGPGSHPSASHAALAFLKSQGLSVSPRESRVPYRPW